MTGSILGVDSAWTQRGNTGIALLELKDGEATLVSAAPSCTSFLAGQTDWMDPASDRGCEMGDLLDYLGPLDGIALDIPLAARTPVSRRYADNEISRAYGALGASTHSPVPDRPGKIATALYSSLVASGYRHLTSGDTSENDEPFFIETYPHPVIIDLMGLDYRLEYKVRNRSKFWKELSTEERWRKSAAMLDQLRAALDDKMNGVKSFVPSARALLEDTGRSRTRVLQGIEDALDAVVCAYAGWKVSEGRGIAFGDLSAAIWLPAKG